MARCWSKRNILVVQMAEMVHRDRYIATALLCLLCLEHFISLIDEWDFVRNSRIRFVNILFLFNRHTVLVVFAINLAVSSFGFTSLSTNLFSLGTVFVVLSNMHACHLELYVFSENRVYVGEEELLYIVASAITIGLTLSHNIQRPTLEPTLHICIHHPVKWELATWGILCAHNVLLLVVTGLHTRWDKKSGRGSSHLVNLFYRDAWIYSSIVSLCAIANILKLSLASTSVNSLLNFYTPAVLSITVSRLVFNMRRARLSYQAKEQQQQQSFTQNTAWTPHYIKKRLSQRRADADGVHTDGDATLVLGQAESQGAFVVDSPRPAKPIYLTLDLNFSSFGEEDWFFFPSPIRVPHEQHRSSPSFIP
ncbi:hypothetical protein BD410DRAFT_545142 [Rickenella mellea]|uniref:DUF6533 domain-containing protein n=1 Tax=Rickenella mellea TaxID=50990 RepID=A0A4Y7PSN7_9AGAM|nr:hypothetical protein BD410DRAFT_545142 [Rickenella mellea]